MKKNKARERFHYSIYEMTSSASYYGDLFSFADLL